MSAAKSKRKSHAAARISDDPRRRLDAIFGPPPLLEGEDPKGYEALLAQVTSAVEPQDILEQIWVRDFVDITWEILRLRRLRIPAIVAGYGEAIKNILAAQFGYSRASDMADMWVRDANETREEVDGILYEMGLTMDDVQARALAVKITVIERMDRMTEAAEYRRRLIFLEIERRRDTLARRLREAAQTIEAEIIQEEAQALPSGARAPA